MFWFLVLGCMFPDVRRHLFVFWSCKILLAMVDRSTYDDSIVDEYFWYWVMISVLGGFVIVTRDLWVRWAGRRQMYVMEDGLEPVLNI